MTVTVLCTRNALPQKVQEGNATRSALKFNVHKDGTYVGCHRYDQSALNIILAKYFGSGVWNKVVKRKITSQLLTIVRIPQGIYPVIHHSYCNHTQILA